MIDKILQPLLSLHGWEAYLLVGLLVFAEAAIMLGFVFPGETAAILGGVLASKGGVSLAGITVTVVGCAIVGDSVGYWVGDKWGRKLLQIGPLKKRQKGLDMALDQLRRRGATAVFLGRFTAFLRAVIPGLAGLSRMRYRIFLPANAAGGICWGLLYVFLGYFVGQRVEKATGIASDILAGLIVVIIVVAVIRHHRKEKAYVGSAATDVPDLRAAGTGSAGADSVGADSAGADSVGADSAGTDAAHADAPGADATPLDATGNDRADGERADRKRADRDHAGPDAPGSTATG